MGPFLPRHLNRPAPPLLLLLLPKAALELMAIRRGNQAGVLHYLMARCPPPACPALLVACLLHVPASAPAPASASASASPLFDSSSRLPGPPASLPVDRISPLLSAIDMMSILLQTTHARTRPAGPPAHPDADAACGRYLGRGGARPKTASFRFPCPKFFFSLSLSLSLLPLEPGSWAAELH
ncbi:hypothetical protein GGTG_13937 [Gaeumannomyces tritici R3-111a-1]|uniref:Uncharacterized protein n=1 Tax=Gaeumannomyces tritici (strain R3-111a-1) TaxID=644352 RepID=J3PK88_GAET3|nr:hypothetical protein GGTG_13937 [Gaeumannomyces tritici R3-111a-1]EJT68485.1 hypothetical protein GGTG_13937 [Gaeumannomyces tritici R3-111a-1]